MNRLQTIDDKISQLKQLKAETETKMARALYKKTETIFGKDLDPTLVTIVLEEAWKTATLEQKEVWRHKARTFSDHKRTKLPPQGSAPIDAVA